MAILQVAVRKAEMQVQSLENTVEQKVLWCGVVWCGVVWCGVV